MTGSAVWQWSKSRSKSGWADIDKATSSMYTPDEDGKDSGYYLRATAKYKDKQSPSGAGNDKTASMVSANKVLALRTTNKAPEFAASDDDDDFYVRTVAETAAAGQLVGDPVTAEDEDANDVLTYTLADASNNFVIDRATGQISVAKGAKFNVTTNEADVDGVTEADSYMVTVVVTDPTDVLAVGLPTVTTDGAYGMVEVTINVTQVDEPPLITARVGGGDINEDKVVAVSFEETTGTIAVALATFTADGRGGWGS